MDPKQLKEIHKQLQVLAKKGEVESSSFNVPIKLKEESDKGVQSRLNDQKPWQRNALLVLIFILTIGSFLLLTGVIVFQMYWRICYPEYNGVSDSVINILAGGVFAELVAVLAVIAKLVWQDPK